MNYDLWVAKLRCCGKDTKIFIFLYSFFIIIFYLCRSDWKKPANGSHPIINHKSKFINHKSFSWPNRKEIPAIQSLLKYNR